MANLVNKHFVFRFSQCVKQGFLLFLLLANTLEAYSQLQEDSLGQTNGHYLMVNPISTFVNEYGATYCLPIGRNFQLGFYLAKVHKNPIIETFSVAMTETDLCRYDKGFAYRVYGRWIFYPEKSENIAVGLGFTERSKAFEHELVIRDFRTAYVHQKELSKERSTKTYHLFIHYISTLKYTLADFYVAAGIKKGTEISTYFSDSKNDPSTWHLFYPRTYIQKFTRPSVTMGVNLGLHWNFKKKR